MRRPRLKSRYKENIDVLKEEFEGIIHIVAKLEKKVVNIAG